MEKTLYEQITEEALTHASGRILNIALGNNMVAVETEAGVGMAFMNDNPDTSLAGRYTGTSAADLIALYPDAGDDVACLALATLNSFLVGQGEPEARRWPEKLAGIKKLAMVGMFKPMLRELENSGIKISVFEIKDIPGTFRPQEAPSRMPECDGVIITGATFANHTFHTYLPCISESARTFITGPSTPFTGVLRNRFELGSSLVKNKKEVFAAVKEGRCVNSMGSFLEKVILRRAV